MSKPTPYAGFRTAKNMIKQEVLEVKKITDMIAVQHIFEMLMF